MGHALLGDALLGHALLGDALLGDVLLGHALLGVENCRLPLKHAKGESTEKVGRGAILPFFLLITYGHSQLSTIGGVRFFV
ncbi:MAG: hypothetical protein SPE55_08955, partial [Sodaliphilus sp.]|nr:hypothetical protein [Sodaliphilus sp.]